MVGKHDINFVCFKAPADWVVGNYLGIVFAVLSSGVGQFWWSLGHSISTIIGSIPAWRKLVECAGLSMKDFELTFLNRVVWPWLSSSQNVPWNRVTSTNTGIRTVIWSVRGEEWKGQVPRDVQCESFQTRRSWGQSCRQLWSSMVSMKRKLTNMASFSVSSHVAMYYQKELKPKLLRHLGTTKESSPLKLRKRLLKYQDPTNALFPPQCKKLFQRTKWRWKLKLCLNSPATALFRNSSCCILHFILYIRSRYSKQK